MTQNSTSTKITAIFTAVMAVLTLTACQKSEPKSSAESSKSSTQGKTASATDGDTAQSSTESANDNDGNQNNSQEQAKGDSSDTVHTVQIDDSTITTTPDIQVEKVNDVLTVSNTDTPPASPANSTNNMPIEEQITDVDYRSATGETLKVTFQTSAIDELQANVTIPSGKKLLLTAPEGQGNNPTYRSADGSVELVSHGGGGSVDLLQNGQLINFNAVSAEAEVVTKE